MAKKLLRAVAVKLAPKRSFDPTLAMTIRSLAPEVN
jgi:hypothetical protein